MYEKDGRQYFVVDGHTHFWDARPENRNKYGEGFIACFYDYHRNLSPEEYVWDKEKYDRYSEEDLIHDLFEIGYVDKAIFQPTYLREFFPGGFNTTEQDAEIAAKHPDRFIVNGSFDPRDRERGLDELRRLKDIYRDAFDVADVDHAASEHPELNFIVEHVGLPRLEDFCWIATQEPNVYGGFAVAMPFIHTRPKYFAQMIGECLYWIGEDRVLFASDYAIWQPKWLVEMFMDFQIPEDMQSELGTISDDQKAKFLGLNAARLYDIEVPASMRVSEEKEEVAIGSEPVSAA